MMNSDKKNSAKRSQNILVIPPDLPDPAQVEWFAHTLSFLQPYCNLAVIDPLSIIDSTLDNKAYYLAWQHYLKSQLQQYDAFIGFSLGGVILQQCFPIFEGTHVPIVLFSTPSFVDKSLHQKLTTVIDLCEKKQVKAALDTLYTTVYHPNPRPLNHWETLNEKEAAYRMINGFQRVLSSNATSLLKKTTVPHYHFIGEYSDLVNVYNVTPSKAGTLITVPKASMRVLEDNLSFCQPLIMKALGYQHE